MIFAPYRLEKIEQWNYLSWYMTTQTDQRVTVLLRDETKVYAEGEQHSNNIAPPLAQGAASIAGNDLYLEVAINDNSELDAFINEYNITRPDGTIVGVGYDIMIEDHGPNGDYNDVAINLVAWKTKG